MNLVSAGGVAAGALAGALTWTFLEYVLHRWAFHEARGRNPASRQHLRHHAEVDWFVATWEKVLLGVFVCGGSATLGGLLLGAPGVAFGFGLGAMYGVYEVVHRLIHVRAPRTAYGRFVCRHHLAHHFHDPFRNHGVSSPLWDLVFRTYVSSTEVRVPPKQRHKLPWLVDAEGEIRPAFRDVYRLGGRASGPRDGAESGGPR